jgi:hypothetical protein
MNRYLRLNLLFVFGTSFVFSLILVWLYATICIPKNLVKPVADKIVVPAFSGQTEWSEVFPQIDGLQREITSINRRPDVKSVWLRTDYKIGERVVGFISIELRPEIGRRILDTKEDRFGRIIKPARYIENHPVFKFSPPCGNDPNPGETVVVLDNDKVLTVSGRFDNDAAVNAMDLSRLKTLMNKHLQP